MRNFRSFFTLIFILTSSFLWAQQARPSVRPSGNILTALIPYAILIIIVIFIVVLTKRNKLSINIEILRGYSKNFGIIFCVLGGTAMIWVIARLTNLAGKYQSWEPPFSEYETITIVGGIIAILLIIIGLISLTRKKG